MTRTFFLENVRATLKSINYPSFTHHFVVAVYNIQIFLWPEAENGKEQDFCQFAYIFKENTTSIDLEYIICFHLMVV